MSTSSLIRIQDAESLLRIGGELAEVKGGFATRCSHLVNRLCEVMDAQVGVAGVMRDDPVSGSPVIMTGVQAGFLDETSQRLLGKYIKEIETHSRDPLLGVMRPSGPEPYTIFRRGCVSDQNWYGSEFVNEVKFRMKIDDAIYADYPLHDLKVSVAFGLNRLRGDKPFGEREQALLQLLNRNLGWFYRQVVKEIRPGTPVLPPALRRVLAELLTGASEKQIARTLELSKHTVHDHIKKLYVHFGVSSRPELMARFIP